MSTPKLKVSGVVRVDDPHPRVRIELSGVMYLDAEDVVALNDLMALPPPKPPVFSQAEQNRHAAEYNAKLDRERDEKVEAQAYEEDRLREQFPELAEELLASKDSGGVTPGF